MGKTELSNVCLPIQRFESTGGRDTFGHRFEILADYSIEMVLCPKPSVVANRSFGPVH